MLQQIHLVLAALLLSCTLSGFAAIIDHNDIPGVATLPQTTLDLIGQQTWFFTHASVGSNMRTGLTNLHTLDPDRYQLVVTNVSYNTTLQRAYDAPTNPIGGRVYACNRSNPGWQSKLTIFEDSLDSAGWHGVDVVMNKFCYIDQGANVNDYLDSMIALETAYPNTQLVYMTMPLTDKADANNALRNVFNDAVRDYCLTNHKLLFDIADIESHDPAGTPITFDYGGETYQKLYSGYTTDGGHLNDGLNLGQQQVALGWYATAAVIAVPEPGTVVMLASVAGVAVGWCAVRRARRQRRSTPARRSWRTYGSTARWPARR